MSKNKAVEFNKEELKKLIEDKNSCVTVHKSFYNLALYPYHLTSLTSSIKDILNAGVAKYDKKLDGILLGYKNVKILTPQGAIVTDSCYIHVDIEADFYIFKPEVGATLTGIVNKKSKDHVGCLVHSIFNVSVPNKSEDETWPGYNVEIGQEVLLQVTYINLDARLPYIRTSFISTKSKKKKRKSKTIDEVDVATGENEIQEFKLNKIELNTSVLNNEDQVNVQIHKKKKKKSKEAKNNEINNVANTILNSTTELKIEKKKRKNKDKNHSLTKLNITAEEEKISNVINNTLDSSAALESHKKKKRRSKENSIILKKLDVTEEKVSNIQDISINTNAELKSQKKKKRKSIDKNDISANVSKNSNVLSEKHLTKVNGIDTDLQALRNSLLAEQLANLNQLETPKNSKKRKRQSDDLNIETKLNDIEIPLIIQSEVRKSKKRKSSFNENMSEDNPALRDSYANTTIDDSYNSPKKSKKHKHKNTHDKSELGAIINNSIVIETNNKKRKHSMSESEETELKKKKRKKSVTESQNESQDLDDSSSKRKKHKSKKSDNKNR